MSIMSVMKEMKERWRSEIRQEKIINVKTRHTQILDDNANGTINRYSFFYKNNIRNNSSYDNVYDDDNNNNNK